RRHPLAGGDPRPNARSGRRQRHQLSRRDRLHGQENLGRDEGRAPRCRPRGQPPPTLSLQPRDEHVLSRLGALRHLSGHFLEELHMNQDLAMSSISDDTSPLTQIEIDQRVFDLYDEYCHGRMDRREFLTKSAAVTAGGLAMAQALLPRYARAQTISFTDPRIKARSVSYPSAGGTSGTMRGYLVQPAGNGPFPTVLVIHENRGLNPYIEDVARRAATEGFLALAPDGLSPVGGYPGNDDDGR